MKKLIIAAGVLFALGAATVPMLVKQTPVVAGETSPCVSGYAPGEGTPVFNVKDVTGPWKADPSVCYI